MKKGLALLLVLTLILVGCGSSSSQPAASGGAAQSGSSAAPSGNGDTPSYGKKNLSLVTGGTGGTTYYMGTGQAKIITEKVPGVTCTNESTSGTPIENTAYVNENVDILGHTNLDGIYYAYIGDEGHGFSEPMSNVRLIQIGHQMFLHCITMQGSGIETYSDLKGKKISLPDVGNTAYYWALGVLEGYGLTDKDYTGYPMAYGEAGDALKDGSLDAIFVCGGLPQATALDLDTSRDIKLLSIEDDVLKKLCEEHPTWTPYVVTPGDPYSDVTEPVNTLTIKSIIMCNVDADEEMIYQITKALNENVDMMKEIHAQGGEWCAEETEPFWRNPPVPFHEGANRYYREIFGN